MLSFVRLIIWGLIWLLTWPTVTLYRWIAKKPRLDNCFTWALRRWDEEDDSYLVIRWARVNTIKWIRWPHFMWLSKTDHHNLKHFMPLEFQQDYHMFPKAFFEGKVVTGDEEDEHLEN